MRGRGALVVALAGAALLPAPAAAATPMSAVIVHLAPTAAPAHGLPAREVAGWLERAGRRSQGPTLALLAQLQREGHVRHVRPLWIAGAVAVTADASAVSALRARPDVRSIEADSVLPIRPGAAAAAEPGNAATGAPELWSNGIDGTGVTVATLDTGVDLTHAELASRYRGGGNSWFDPFGQHSEPADLNGHGTQVTGVIVAGSGMGMAPGARFIAARVFNDSGVSTDSAVHLAFQWLLDPDGNPATHDAPNVVNASWGAQLAACDREFEPDLQALRAAQILPSSQPATMARGHPPTPRPPISRRRSPSVPRRRRRRSRRSPASVPRAAAAASFRHSWRPGRACARPIGSASRRPASLDLVRGAARRRRTRAPAPGRPPADLGGSGEPARPERARPRRTRARLDLRRRLAGRRRRRAPALSDARLQRARALGSHVIGCAVHGARGRRRLDDRRRRGLGRRGSGVGAGQPMAAADGSFDAASEDLVATVPGLVPGDHTMGFRARDAAGNWSSASLLVISVPSPSAPPAPLSSNTPAGASAAVATPSVATPAAATL